MSKCKKCKGSGNGEYIKPHWESPPDQGHFENCERCNGTGNEPEICYDCSGSGWIIPTENYVNNSYQDYKISLQMQGFSSDEISQKIKNKFGKKCKNCNGTGNNKSSSWW